jgi:predicted HTH transcriptional regulator
VEKELVQLCKLGETTTTQYKLEFTTQKQIAEELVAFANTRGGVIIFGAEDKTGKMIGLTYEQVQYMTRELGNTANEQVRPIIYLETEVVMHEEKAFLFQNRAKGRGRAGKGVVGG